MKITEEDYKETLVISQLIKKIEQIDEAYVNNESDIIFQKQPFLISLILGYKIDLNEYELEEIMKVVFLIWEFFKNHSQIEHQKISETQFERIQQRNVYMLKYYEGEKGESAKMDVVAADLMHLKSKSLFTGILFQFDHKSALINIDEEKKGIILVGLKSLIECFEEIVFKN
jgi:hypothetical protein